MKLNKYGLMLTLLLFIVSVSSVTATDTDLNCSLSDVNCSNLNNNNCLSVNDSSYIENHDVICDDDKYCCGAIAFQSVLKENGVNITIEEANKAIHSVNGTTSMQGLIDGARKYNLTAYPINADGIIFHMNINGTGHWATIDDYFDNYMIIINKNPNCCEIIGVKHGWKTGFIFKNGRWHVGSYRVPIHRM